MVKQMTFQTQDYNITIYQGADLDENITLYSDSVGTKFDLTGYTARMQIRATVNSSSVIKELTTENGGIILGGTLGTIKIYMPATQTDLITSSGVYDLELVNITGGVIRLLQGSATLSLQVTR